MMYEFHEYHNLREGLDIHITAHKFNGESSWNAAAYLVPAGASSICLFRVEYPTVRTPEQFADMLRTIRAQTACELERWGGVVGKRIGANDSLY